MSAEKRLLFPEEDQFKLARELQDRNLFGIFDDPEIMTLKSGRLSPYYLDVRKGISSFNTRQLIAESLLQLTGTRLASGPSVADFYDHIAGTPDAMTTYVTTMANITHVNLLQPRSNLQKTSGNKAPILGVYGVGERVAAYDDVVTDGQSKIDNIIALEKAGLEVDDYFVVLDREEGGAPHVAEVTGIQITPALGVSSMVRMLKAERQISAQQFDRVARYLNEYGEPHAKETINTAL